MSRKFPRKLKGNKVTFNITCYWKFPCLYHQCIRVHDLYANVYFLGFFCTLSLNVLSIKTKHAVFAGLHHYTTHCSIFNHRKNLQRRTAQSVRTSGECCCFYSEDVSWNAELTLRAPWQPSSRTGNCLHRGNDVYLHVFMRFSLNMDFNHGATQ